MKKRDKELLKGKLFRAIKAVLKDNNDELKPKTEKAIKKSIKRIVDKTRKKKVSAKPK
ncbi:MAG: hypothetical protein ACXVP0_04340 [Bacteroidia bacterium]